MRSRREALFGLAGAVILSACGSGVTHGSGPPVERPAATASAAPTAAPTVPATPFKATPRVPAPAPTASPSGIRLSENGRAQVLCAPSAAPPRGGGDTLSISYSNPYIGLGGSNTLTVSLISTRPRQIVWLLGHAAGGSLYVNGCTALYVAPQSAAYSSDIAQGYVTLPPPPAPTPTPGQPPPLLGEGGPMAAPPTWPWQFYVYNSAASPSYCHAYSSVSVLGYPAGIARVNVQGVGTWAGGGGGSAVVGPIPVNAGRGYSTYTVTVTLTDGEVLTQPVAQIFCDRANPVTFIRR